MAERNRALSRSITLCAIAMVCLAAPAVHAQWVNYKVPGVPRTPDGKVNLTAPTPRTPDGKPDLSGTWHSDGGYFGNLARDLKPGELLMLPVGGSPGEGEPAPTCTRTIRWSPACRPACLESASEGAAACRTPSRWCRRRRWLCCSTKRPPTRRFARCSSTAVRTPTDPQPTWLGYSIGRWDGDTLVVDTTGFNGRSWIDTGSGHPQTDAGRVTERYTRRDFGHMEIDITIDDPKAYAEALAREGAGQSARGFRSDRNGLRKRKGYSPDGQVVQADRRAAVAFGHILTSRRRSRPPLTPSARCRTVPPSDRASAGRCRGSRRRASDCRCAASSTWSR